MSIEYSPTISRAHKLGRYDRISTRPIIVYFVDSCDTEYIISVANRLKGTVYHINRDFPQEITNARRTLCPIYKDLLKDYPDSKISIVYPAKIIKDGRAYADMFPQWSLGMQGRRFQYFSNKLFYPSTQSHNPPERAERFFKGRSLNVERRATDTDTNTGSSPKRNDRHDLLARRPGPVGLGFHHGEVHHTPRLFRSWRRTPSPRGNNGARGHATASVNRILLDSQRATGSSQPNRNGEHINRPQVSTFGSPPDTTHLQDVRGNSVNIKCKIFFPKFGLKRRIEYPDFVELVNQYDIFCVSETHIDSNDIADIPGYTFSAKNRSQPYLRKSGGIGIYLCDKLAPFVDVIENVSEYVLWISIKNDFLKQDENIVLRAIYLPPEHSRFVSEDIISEFENEISQKCAEHTGDTKSRTCHMKDFVTVDNILSDLYETDADSALYLNKYTILENLSVSLERPSHKNRTNTHGMRLNEICRNNNLFLLNGRLFSDRNVRAPTYRDKSINDYAFPQPECFEFVSDFGVYRTDRIF